MNIVVLDGYALNPGDLSWAPFESMGSLTVYDRTSPEQVEARARLADAVLTVRTPLNREIIRHLGQLRFIGVLGSDPSHVNVEIARKRGIEVADAAGADVESTAQLAMALLLELTHGVGHHAHLVRGGRWCRGPDFTFRLHALTELQGRTIGLVGLGRIGTAVARMAAAFGMEVLAHDPFIREAPPHVQLVPLEELASRSDVVSLHAIRTPATEHLVNEAFLHRMKKSAFLINTAHGALIDETALAAALRAGRIAGAAVDVLSEEPPSPKNPLLRAPRCLITPHLGWGTVAARERIVRTVADKLRQFVEKRAAAL
ncbi:MAG: D-2-hydroxyacid dehydrogenase [Kiritimatiellae bacterium]|nr:D-2-hydroxyacid dehydrogenase [Kiritimatiellia bacterium]MDW8458878.1 NAD(P)-dependent oxidoreductase [Verrucomicrobiota bacterium]